MYWPINIIGIGWSWLVGLFIVLLYVYNSPIHICVLTKYSLLNIPPHNFEPMYSNMGRYILWFFIFLPCILPFILSKACILSANVKWICTSNSSFQLCVCMLLWNQLDLLAFVSCGFVTWSKVKVLLMHNTHPRKLITKKLNHVIFSDAASIYECNSFIVFQSFIPTLYFIIDTLMKTTLKWSNQEQFKVYNLWSVCKCQK
jgi:hypothetical protein